MKSSLPLLQFRRTLPEVGCVIISLAKICLISSIREESQEQASTTSGASATRDAFGYAKWCTTSAYKKESENWKGIISFHFYIF